VAFSLSHTNGMVACAVTSAAAVGVDVERLDRGVDAAKIAARFFAPEETAQLTRLDGDARRAHFCDIWTLKEALVKALGTGIASSLASLAFTVDGARVTLAAPQLDTNAWHFRLFAPSPVHRLAVAVQLAPSVEPRFIFRSVTDAP
jgi:4'-phosphopantetheinyl transferase